MDRSSIHYCYSDGKLEIRTECLLGTSSPVLTNLGGNLLLSTLFMSRLVDWYWLIEYRQPWVILTGGTYWYSRSGSVRQVGWLEKKFFFASLCFALLCLLLFQPFLLWAVQLSLLFADKNICQPQAEFLPAGIINNNTESGVLGLVKSVSTTVSLEGWKPRTVWARCLLSTVCAISTTRYSALLVGRSLGTE